MGKYQRRDKMARLISWGHWFTFTNILLCLALGTLYLDAANPPQTVLGTLYLVVSWLGHFAFLPFVFFIVVIFPFCLILPYARVLRGIAAVTSSFGLIALAADALFYRQYGYHLNSYSIAQLAKDAEQAFAGGSFVIIISTLLVFLLILALQMVLANLTWKRLGGLQERRIGAPVTAVFVLCFFSSHSIHIWADAALYDPVTQQDDLFPVFYPTTAKTLMAKHGLITVENYQARQQAITQPESINLVYPLSPLLCAKNNQPQSTLLVVFDQLSTQQQQQLNQPLQALGLQPQAITLLGHPSRRGGAFQLLYGLPDFYQSKVESEQQLPAYQSPLENFSVQVRHLTTTQWPDDVLPNPLQPAAQPLSQHRINIDGALQFTVIYAAASDVEQVLDALQQAQADQQRVLVTSLSPQPSDERLGAARFHVPSMQVPLWSEGVAIAEGQLAGLQDIVPTALAGLMSCAEGSSNYSNGRNLQFDKSNQQLVESYAPYIVIYDSQRTSVLDGNGQITVFDRADGNIISGAEPPTPVLINALQQLKRFSRSEND
ncbi:DUF3413 domain-containing protein [Idiomarina xiamenensis]|uniref:Alkaline phosphatase n=1 Tax=Idiomarina xiamenensis 10-D-4 TaxID=740709 RepID=K2JYZ7_9GAMM|nr:DUF3413 domain-containing protein [Idiomarina xiamenensis]EKE79832.1 alkaline phosphatase [Idiomarina xiamenensis 10-D-4]